VGVLSRLRPAPWTSRELLLSAAAAGGAALLAIAAAQRLGTVGLLAPLVLALGVVVLLRPVLAVSLVVGLTILAEGPTFGLFSFTQHFYVQLYKDVSLLDALVILAVVSVALDVLRRGRQIYIPPQLAFPLLTLALGMVAGVIVGRAGGASVRFAVTSEHVLFYLLLLPLAIANLDLDRPAITRLLGCLLALALLKAVLGLVEVAGHQGAEIEGSSTLTYYEPTANWLLMASLLGVLAAVLARARPPLWVLASSPVIFACLLFSYRRSFWIGATLGILLVVLLGLSPLGRRLLLPAVVGIVGAILLLGSVNFQSQLPLAKRFTSLAPSKLQANVEDRYRLDERANVLAEIRAHPITGLGMAVPWAATAHTLSVEGEGESRQYVHFAALWFWLKLGILGLVSYLGIVFGSIALAWRCWRRSPEPLLRCFGLGSLCAFAGLLAIETTATFTGVDPRFTVLLGAQIGLLALVARGAGSAEVRRSPRGG
jgi:hypothetical protein